MKIDDTNIAIIKMMRQGKTSIKQIAAHLGLAENTVRTRIAKMESDEQFEIAGLIDPQKIPRHSVVMVGVKLATMDLVKKGEEFSKLRGVVSVSVITGRFDLMLIVLLKEGFGILEFYTEEVSRLKDVSSVETFLVYKSYNLKIPYIL
ncbi:MAG: Lrp/AsnC family transcriptional regulator [Desulfobacteraceae bacterium]|nr:Lrp/AsnC family transcriptional regulator [Desulfobacteraceae bacterium]